MTGSIGRREFITLLSCAAAWPVAAKAQHRTPVIGFLSSLPQDSLPQSLLARGDEVME
jgi:hypothetical protein